MKTGTSKPSVKNLIICIDNIVRLFVMSLSSEDRCWIFQGTIAASVHIVLFCTKFLA